MPVQDDWEGYSEWIDPQAEVQRMFRAYPVYPMTGIPQQWIDRSDPNYQESIFQGQIGGFDPLGTLGSLKYAGPRQTGWWSALKRALELPEFVKAQKMRGKQLLDLFKKFGVSSEELRWTKIKELAERAGDEPVDMAVVKDLAEVNRIRLKDVNLGERKIPDKLVKLTDAARDRETESYHRLSKLPSLIVDAAFNNSPEEFEEIVRKLPLRISKSDAEAAAAQGLSRIDYTRQLKDQYITAQRQYIEDQNAVRKLENLRYKLRKKTQPKHLSYIANKPLPAPDEFYNFLVRLKHSSTPVSGGQHYNFEDVVVGVLADERTTMDGLKGLNIEEYQSDWSKSIRRFGVEQKRPAHIEEKYQALLKERQANNDLFWDHQEKIIDLRSKYYDMKEKYSGNSAHEKVTPYRTAYLNALSKSSEISQAGEAIGTQLEELEQQYPKKGGVPDMPFQDSKALELGLKKALWEAARRGADVITWVKGKDIHELRVGNDPDQKWPYYVYDQFTPSRLKKILKDIGIKDAEVVDIKYPGNLKFPEEHQKRYETLEDRLYDVSMAQSDIEEDAHLDDEDYTQNEMWRQLEEERNDLQNEINKLSKENKVDVGYEVWGIKLSPEAIQKILDKGIKIGKRQETAGEMLA